MSEGISTLLALSASGTLLALILFILKPLLRHRSSKTLQYYLWLVVLLRLVLPVSIPVGAAVFNFNPAALSSSLSKPNDNTVSLRPPAAGGSRASASAAGPASKGSGQVSSLQNTTGRFNPGLFLLGHLFELWLLGAILSFLIQAGGYLRFSRRLGAANRPVSREQLAGLGLITKKKLPVYTNRFAPTPMLLGLFRPRILIPDADFTQEQLGNIYLHELTHLRRRDVALKWCTVAVTSVHWFNPMMYFLKKEIARSCELACDESVIRAMGPSARQSYGETLLAMVSENKKAAGVLFTTMCEEKKALKERLRSIMRYKRKRLMAPSFLAVTLVLAITLVSCAAPAKSASPKAGSSSSASSQTISQIAFSSLAYMGQDTNNQDMSSTYQTTDHAAMNQVWNTLDTQSWSETTSFQSKTGEYIELHFEGEQSGWYVISSDNFAYFSLEDGPDLPQDSPLGFVHPGDKSYSIPAGVYNAVSKLLKNYTDQHPPAYNLFDVLKDALTAKDTFIQVPGYSKPLNVHDHPANELLNLYMNAFGDLNKWAPLSKNDIGDFNEAGTDYVAIIHDYVSSHTEITFSLKSNLVCVSVLGITHWYSVPSSVMTNVLNVSEKEIK